MEQPTSAVGERETAGGWDITHKLLLAHGLAGAVVLPVAWLIVDVVRLDYVFGAGLIVGSSLLLAQCNLYSMALNLLRLDRRHRWMVGLNIIAGAFMWALCYLSFLINEVSGFVGFVIVWFGTAFAFGVGAMACSMPQMLFYDRCRLVRPIPDEPPPPWQFSLRGLFWVVTLLAIMLGALRAVNDTVPSASTTSAVIFSIGLTIVVLAGVVCWFSATHILPLWFAFRTRRPALGILLHAAILPGVTLIAEVAQQISSRGWLDGTPTAVAALFGGSYALFSTGSLYLLRRQGYRLVRRPPPDPWAASRAAFGSPIAVPTDGET